MTAILVAAWGLWIAGWLAACACTYSAARWPAAPKQCDLEFNAEVATALLVAWPVALAGTVKFIGRRWTRW